VAREPAVLARVPLSPAEPGSAEDKSRVGHAVLAEALFLASRQGGTPAGLAAGDGPDAQPVPSPGNLTRRAYELRSRWRPTPHGAFAGVAVARVTGPAERACLRLGSSHRPRTGPSGRWLAELEAKLLTETALLDQLRLTASNLVVQRGERLEHRWQGRRSTIRATQASLLVMRLCADGMTGAEVVVELLRRWPASGEAARNVVAEMARGGFVSTDLLPADVTCDPLGHLLGKLPPGHRLDPSLRRLRGLLAAADERAVGDAGRLATLTGARDLADETCLVSRPLVSTWLPMPTSPSRYPYLMRRPGQLPSWEGPSPARPRSPTGTSGSSNAMGRTARFPCWKPPTPRPDWASPPKISRTRQEQAPPMTTANE
jgi:hypothetical protein